MAAARGAPGDLMTRNALSGDGGGISGAPGDDMPIRTLVHGRTSQPAQSRKVALTPRWMASASMYEGIDGRVIARSTAKQTAFRVIRSCRRHHPGHRQNSVSAQLVVFVGLRLLPLAGTRGLAGNRGLPRRCRAYTRDAAAGVGVRVCDYWVAGEIAFVTARNNLNAVRP